MLDTRPKAHDVCEDTNKYLVQFAEKSGNCGMQPDDLQTLVSSMTDSCETSTTWDAHCSVTVRHTCDDVQVTYVLDRVVGEAYIGFAELHLPDCTSLYNVTLTKVIQ